MKEIKAIIQPFMLTRVVTALHKIEGLPGITISDIKGFGKSKGKKEKDDNNEGIYEFIPKNKIEIVVHDDLVDTVVNSIQKNAHTGNLGDGKIFVYGVRDMIRIRTNERGEDAI